MLRDFLHLRILLPVCIFIGALGVGFYVAWPKWLEGIVGGDFDFLQNLLSEGLGVVVTTAIVAPLTAYFVEQRERRELTPVRRALLEQIGRKIDQASRRYLSRFSNLALLKMSLEQTSFGDALDKLSHALRYDRQKNVTAALEDTNPQYARIAQQLNQVATNFNELAHDFESVGRLISIYTPFLTPAQLEDIVKLNNSIEQRIASFDALGTYFQGVASREIRMQAELAYIDFSMPIRMYDELVTKVGYSDLKNTITQGRDAAVDGATQKRFLLEIMKLLSPVLYSEQLKEERDAFR